MLEICLGNKRLPHLHCKYILCTRKKAVLLAQRSILGMNAMLLAKDFCEIVNLVGKESETVGTRCLNDVSRPAETIE